MARVEETDNGKMIMGRHVCFFRRFAAAIRLPSRVMRSRVCSCTLPRLARGP
jgi:hypothetical protein